MSSSLAADVSNLSSSSSASSVSFSVATAVKHAHHYITLKLKPGNYLLAYFDPSLSLKPIPFRTITLSSLSEECFPVIVEKETSAEIWNALATAYANPSNSKALPLHEELLECRQTDSFISTYLGKIKTLADNLVASSRPLSYEDFMTYIFQGLRPEFQHVSTTLHARKENISFEDLLSLLLTQEYIYGGHKESSTNPLPIFSSANRDFPPSYTGQQYGGCFTSSLPSLGWTTQQLTFLAGLSMASLGLGVASSRHGTSATGPHAGRQQAAVFAVALQTLLSGHFAFEVLLTFANPLKQFNGRGGRRGGCGRGNNFGANI